MPTLLLLLACGTTDPAPVAAPPDEPYWVQRSDLELDDTLRATCEQAVAAEHPVLLVFSAPWCIDCQKMKALSAQSPLAEELVGWEKVVIDVGRFERHNALRMHFKVGSIAYLVALRPTDCVAPVTTWPVLASGTFEPASGSKGARSAADVAEWLAAAR